MAAAFDRRRTLMWVSYCAAIAAFVWVFATATGAGASSGGIAGYSGNPATNGGQTCTLCHTGGGTATVAIDGPTSVSTGETASYTFTISGGSVGGFGVSASDGTLGAGNGSKVVNGEVVQSASRSAAGGEVKWTFDWTAPAAPGSVTLYGAGNAANGDRSTSGDDIGTDSLTITVEGANAAPVADPGGPYSGEPGEFLSFDGSASSDGDGSITGYEWDFGDGSPAVAGFASVWHSYPESGVYTVTLTVTDNAGATHTATTSALIGDVSNLPPSADAGGPYSVTAGEAVRLNGSGSSDPEGGSLSYSWDLGDGGSATNRRPSHTYATPGTYTATLVVTDDAGLSDSDTATVTVAAAPTSSTTSQAPSGGSVYSSNCAGCHGGSGQGVGAFPSLQASTMSTAQIRSIVTNGASGMPGYSGSLSSGEISAVASYAKNLQVAGATTTTTEAPTGGADIYSGNCAGCHGANGGGGAGPSLLTSTMSTSGISSIITNGGAGMPGYAASLDSAQISALSAYVKGLQGADADAASDSGGAALYDSNCAGCHGAGGEGGAGPSLLTSTMSLADIEAAIANGLSGMPGYSASLSADEISELSAFTVSLQGADTGAASDSGGAALYDSNCAGCHGAGGEGGAGPSLLTSTMSLADIEAAIANGLSGMPGYSASLSADEISELSAFTLSLQGGSAGTTSTVGDEEGAALYGRYCAACHGNSGEGGIGPALAGTSLSAADVTAVINSGRGVMPAFATIISAEEIDTIANYVTGLGGDAGAPSDGPAVSEETAALYASLCAGCHGDGGQGGPAGPPLVGTALDQAGLVAVIANGQGGMPGYSAQLSAQQIEDLAVLIGAMGQGHDGDGDPTTTSTTLPAPTTTFALGGVEEEDDGGSTGRTLAIILAVSVLAGGGYLALASRRFTRAR